MQELGVDDFDTYTPTPSASCMRLLAALAATRIIKLNLFDVQQAFVQALLKETST